MNHDRRVFAMGMSVFLAGALTASVVPVSPLPKAALVGAIAALVVAAWTLGGEFYGMHSDARLERATLSAFLSYLLAVCLPFLVLTLVAPGARGVLLFFAFPLWILSVRPIDRLAGRLLPTSHGAKPRKAPRDPWDLA